MATPRQIEANRLNAQKSTGPRSATGKAASSMNALKSGIDAKSLIVPGENTADLEALTAEYLGEYQPATPTERCYVDILVRADWQLRRLARADAQIWEFEFNRADNPDIAPPNPNFNSPKAFEVLQRRITATERSFKQAQHELQLLQSSRPSPPTEPGLALVAQPQSKENKPPASPIGFVPSVPPLAPTCLGPTPVPPATPRPASTPAPPPAPDSPPAA